MPSGDGRVVAVKCVQSEVLAAQRKPFDSAGELQCIVAGRNHDVPAADAALGPVTVGRVVVVVCPLEAEVKLVDAYLLLSITA